MLVIQQVLPANGELQVCKWLPDELSIQGVVARYIEAWKPAHVSNSQVMLQMIREVQ